MLTGISIAVRGGELLTRGEVLLGCNLELKTDKSGNESMGGGCWRMLSGHIEWDGDSGALTCFLDWLNIFPLNLIPNYQKSFCHMCWSLVLLYQFSMNLCSVVY